MREHVIYYFSGTGNTLKAALTLQKALGNAEVISMGAKPELLGSLSSIGFVIPCYFGGVPRRVLDFIAKMDFSEQNSPYVYAVVTYGAVLGATIGQLDNALQTSGLHLDYAAPVKAFANYVAMYDMSEKVSQKTAQTKADLAPIVVDILEQKTSNIKKPSALVGAYNRIISKGVHTKDRNFVVQESCTSCGICEQVCPVQNIELVQGKPSWLGHCEQCMACVQWCPERAIDYGSKTRARGRYTNPEITVKMFIDYLNGGTTLN